MANNPKQMFLSPTVINALGMSKSSDTPVEDYIKELQHRRELNNYEYNRLINKAGDVYSTPYSTAEVPAALRWGDKRVDPLSITKVNYAAKQRESLPHVYNDEAAIEHLRRTGKVQYANNRFHEDIDPNVLHALYDATKLNPNLKISSNDVVNMFAQEGRSDLGANDAEFEYIKHNPQSVAMYHKLIKMGYPENAAGLPALILDKQMKANDAGVSWHQLYNGAGPMARRYSNESGMNATIDTGINKEAQQRIQQHMQEPTSPLTTQGVQWQDYMNRRQRIEDMRKAEMNTINSLNPVERYWNYPGLLTGKTPEQYAQERYPDAPIPFPDDPNAAVVRKATGGSIESVNPKAGRKRDI
jgi:hypothetical protein